jgi:hypothetical protein
MLVIAHLLTNGIGFGFDGDGDGLALHVRTTEEEERFYKTFPLVFTLGEDFFSESQERSLTGREDSDANDPSCLRGLPEDQ